MNTTHPADPMTRSTPAAGSADMSAPPPKPWYLSAGVWGALVTLAGSVLALLKVELDPALLDDVREWVLALATLVGGGVALWGRVRASRRIGTAAAPPPPPTPAGPPVLPPPASATGLPRRRAVAVLLPLMLAPLPAASGGCAALVQPAGPYIAADRATFDAVAPDHRAYLAADASLNAEQRARRVRTLDLWRARIEDAERRESRGAGLDARQDPRDPALLPHPGGNGSQASPLREARDVPATAVPPTATHVPRGATRPTTRPQRLSAPNPRTLNSEL